MSYSASENDNIPLADDDPQGNFRFHSIFNWFYDSLIFFLLYILNSINKIAIINDDDGHRNMRNGRSMDSIQSSYTNGSSSPGPNMESDITPDEQEEKARLISQVLELQNTLDGK